MGRGQKQEESISIAEGGSFIAQDNRDHKTNKQSGQLRSDDNFKFTKCYAVV